MSAFDCDVFVAGAGPVGLTLALALQRAGVDLRIIDRSPGFSGESRAITIQPRILECLDLLDAAAPLVAAGVRAGVMHMHAGTKRMTTLRYDRLPTPHAYYLHLHQGESERLLAGILSERGAEIERGLELYGFRRIDSGVEVELRDSAGASRRVRCRYLVGCDGGHSRVRELTKVSFAGERHPDNWIMTDAKIRNFDLARDERHGFMLDTYPFVILPMSEGYYRIIAARPADSPLAGKDPTLDEFHAIARRIGLGHWQLHDPLWLTNYNPSQRVAEDFRHGRVFLAGDAAHVNTPIGAQGLNTGAMDALNLGWKLAWALNHGASEVLLDSYHAERHPVVLGMFRDNDRLTRMVFGKNPIVRGLTRRQLRLLELGPLNLRSAGQSAQLAVHYRDSPLLLPSAASGKRSLLAPAELRAGERIPCPRLRDSEVGVEHLYDLLDGARHTLLVCDDGHDSAAAWVDELRARHASWLRVVHLIRGANERSAEQLRWSDPFGELATTLAVPGGRGAALVRPDGFLAGHLRLGDTRALERYVARLSDTGRSAPARARAG